MPSFAAATSLCLLALLLVPGQERGAHQKGRGGRKPETPAGGEQKPAAPAASDDAALTYFELADYNANGWISFSEASASMALDRRGFALFDADSDGRITQPEFRLRYETIVNNGGAFEPPLGKDGTRAKGPASTIDVALQSDVDGDKALNRTELRSFLEGIHSRLDADVVLSKFDRDGTRELEQGEITALAAFLDPNRRSHPPPRAASIEELFGKSLPREEREAATVLAPRILGPVSPFRRLDLEPDGRITVADLTELQRPVFLPIRTAAVLATLDTNGDGALDQAEFDACMSGN
jgi:hypothetical protein